jgi:hypothetical protein
VMPCACDATQQTQTQKTQSLTQGILRITRARHHINLSPSSLSLHFLPPTHKGAARQHCAMLRVLVPNAARRNRLVPMTAFSRVAKTEPTQTNQSQGTRHHNIALPSWNCPTEEALISTSLRGMECNHAFVYFFLNLWLNVS